MIRLFYKVTIQLNKLRVYFALQFRVIILSTSNIADEPVGSVFDIRQLWVIHCFYNLEYKFTILSLIGAFSKKPPHVVCKEIIS